MKNLLKFILGVLVLCQYNTVSSQTTTQPASSLSQITVTDIPDSSCQHWCKDHCAIPTVHRVEDDVVIGPYPIYIHNHNRTGQSRIDCPVDSTKYMGNGFREDDAYTNGVLRINNSAGSNLYASPNLITFNTCKIYDVKGYATHHSSSPASGTKSEEQLEATYDMTFKHAAPVVPGAPPLTGCANCGEYIHKTGKVIIKFDVYSIDVKIDNGVSAWAGKTCLDYYDWGSKIDTIRKRVTGVTAIGYPEGGTYQWEAIPIQNRIGRPRVQLPNGEFGDYIYLPGENDITITNPNGATINAAYVRHTNQEGMYLICTYTVGGICCKIRICISLISPDPVVQGSYTPRNLVDEGEEEEAK